MKKRKYKKPVIKKITPKIFALTRRQRYSMNNLLFQSDNVLAQYSIGPCGGGSKGIH